MIAFTKILAADFYKTRRTGNLLLAFSVTGLSTLFVFAYFAYKGATNPVLNEGADAWMAYVKMILALYVLLLPLFAAVLSFSMSNVEHKNRGLKQIFTLPAPKSSLYFSKITLLLGWVLFTLVLALFLLYSSGGVIGALFPELGMDQTGSFALIAAFLFKAFASLSAVVAIHFFISIYWNNLVVSIGSACFFVVIGLGLASWEYAFAFPYAAIPQAMNSLEVGVTDLMSREVIWSLGYALVFFGVGYRMMLRKSITA